MIHTQYYALMRSVVDSIDNAGLVPVNQWDFNYNSITFDQLKKYKDEQTEYPKGVINLTSIEKDPLQNKTMSFTPGMYMHDIIHDMHTRLVASINNNQFIYATTGFNTLRFDITITYETAAQMLDHMQGYMSYFPLNYFFYDYTYQFYLSLPEDVTSLIDPYEDETINIYAKQMKDDASNFEFFSMLQQEPTFRYESIQPVQDKNSKTHQIQMSMSIQDSFVNSIIVTDGKEFLKATSLNIEIDIFDFDNSLETIDNITYVTVLVPPIDVDEPGRDMPETITNNETNTMPSDWEEYKGDDQ